MSAHLEKLKQDFATKLTEAKELLELAQRGVAQDDTSEMLYSHARHSLGMFNVAAHHFNAFCDYMPVGEPSEEVAPAKKSLDLDAE
jgi:hypothetical protein